MLHNIFKSTGILQKSDVYWKQRYVFTLLVYINHSIASYWLGRIFKGQDCQILAIKVTKLKLMMLIMFVHWLLTSNLSL